MMAYSNKKLDNMGSDNDIKYLVNIGSDNDILLRNTK